MQGQDSYWLDHAASIQEQKYTVYRTLPVLKSGTIFADCRKRPFSISFPEVMVGVWDFFCT